MNLNHLVPRTQISGSSVTKADLTTGALSDTVNLRAPACGIHALASGTIRVLDTAGNTSDIAAVAGTDYPRSILRVFATGSTLSNAQIVLLFPLAPA